MTDDTDHDYPLTLRQLRVLLIVTIVIAAAAPFAMAAFLDQAITVQNRATYGTTGSGLEVTIVGNHQFDGNRDWASTNAVDLQTSEGNITVRSTGAVTLEIPASNINGTVTEAENIANAGSVWLELDPDDKQQVNVTGNVSRVQFRSMSVADGTQDFEYNTSGGSMQIAITGLPASTQVGVVATDTTELLDVATTDASGTAVFTLPDGDHTAALETGVAPVANDTSMSPTGPLTQNSVTLQIDINDSDFPEGDTVTGTFKVNGPNDNSFQDVGTDSRSTNGTLSVNFDAHVGGDYDWQVELEDGYGKTDTSATKTFSAPAEVEIRNESEPHALITQTTGVEVRIFGSDETLDDRSISDGTINMTGLPVNESYVFVVNPDGYHQRSIVIRDLFEQNQIYVLNESKPTATVTFALDDQTGRFADSDTTLIIQKSINKSIFDSSAAEKYTWETIAGDRIGASEQYTVDLRQDDRYRLIVSNGQETRTLGEYTADGDADEVLPVGQIQFPRTGDTGVGTRAYIEEVNGNRVLKIVYRDLNESTSEVTYNVTRPDGTVVVANTTTTGTFGTFTASHVLNDPNENKTFHINLWATRQPADVQDRLTVGGVGPLNLPIDPRWLELMGWVGIVAMGGLTAIVDDRLGAITLVAVATLFTMLEIVSIAPVALGIGAATAIVYTVGRQRL